MNHFGRTNKTVRYIRPGVGLSASCSRFSKNFFVISQKRCSKVAFCNESSSKRDKNFLWSDAKICKLYSKSKISKHFFAIWRHNQRRWITLSSIITQKCNEPIQLLNDILQPRHSSQSSVNLHPLFEFSLKTANLAAWLLLSCAHDLLQGEAFGSFFTGNS